MIAITVDKTGITVADNGPGIPGETVKGVLDFAVRVSSREAYVSPTRGAQGNALKTIVAMPFVLDGRRGHVEIEAQGVCHAITFEVDHVRQEPVIRHDQTKCKVKVGTVVRVPWWICRRPSSMTWSSPMTRPNLTTRTPKIHQGQSAMRSRDFYKLRRTTHG